MVKFELKMSYFKVNDKVLVDVTAVWPTFSTHNIIFYINMYHFNTICSIKIAIVQNFTFLVKFKFTLSLSGNCWIIQTILEIHSLLKKKFQENN